MRGQGHLFRVARDDAEKQICDKLSCKLDEFMELETYDWLLVEPQGQASSFITDLISFLQTTFASFANIPVSFLFFFSYKVPFARFGFITNIEAALILSNEVEH